MNSKFLRLSFVIGILAFMSTIASAQSGTLRAGAGKAETTPPPEMMPLKDIMSTFGSVHDPLYARALVLDNGKSKVALVDIDLIQMVAGDEIVKAVCDELGIPTSNVIVTMSHDHNTPHVVTGRFNSRVKAPYYDVVKKGVLEAVRQANANLQPARIGFGTGKAYVNTNRDEIIGDAYHMGYAPEGPSDKTVSVVLITKPTGEPIAVYFNYPVHSVVMFPAKTKGDMPQITSDLGGWTANYVEDHFKGAVALFTMGPAGDQNPLFMAYYNQDAPDVHDEGAAGYALLDVESRRLGEEVVRVSKNIQNTFDKVVLWGGEAIVSCPGRKPVNSQLGWPGQGQGELGQVGAGAGQPGQAQAGERQPGQEQDAPREIEWVDGDPVNIHIGLVMVNDIAIGGIAGEPFSDIGQQIKKGSIFDRFLIATLMPDDVGYVPSDLAYTLPSEKAVNNKLKPGCAGPALTEGFQKLERSYLPVLHAAAQ